MSGETLVMQMRAAVAAQRRGDLVQAIAVYRQVLQQDPRIPEAHNNLAVALKAAGYLDEAAASFRTALSLRPDYPAAHSNFASALLQLDRDQDALRHLLQAVRLEPEKRGHIRLLAETLRRQRFSAASPDVLCAVERCFEVPDIEHQLISAATLSLVRLDPAVDAAFRVLASDGPPGLLAALREGRLTGLFSLGLLQRVLSQTLVADRDFESLLTVLRRGLLEQTAVALPSDAQMPFMIALAQQCFLTDYAYAESSAEAAAVERLGNRLTGPQPDLRLATVLALYRRLPAACADHGNDGQDFASLLRQQIVEPQRELAIAEQLPALTAIGNPISHAVRSQYEAHPYPRWQTTRSRPARPLPEIAAELLPGLAAPPPARRPTRILVAGCGTGRHAAAVATRYSHAHVLAIDLSRTSLAFAQRKAEEASLDQVRFAQGDILALGALEQQFDLIECSGVLHHLDDPLAGWRVLVDLLAEQGLMKIGLYSRRARRHFEAAKMWLAEAGFIGDADGLRAARQALLALDPVLPAAQVVRELDFFSLSGCRDLLFNEQECSYDLLEIAGLLEQLGLQFLGFEFVDGATPAAYRTRYPADRSLTDLAQWHQFEAEAPDSFHNMYQFWCRRSG